MVESPIASALKRVFVAGFEAEDVAGQMEGADLAAAVLQDLVGPHRAA